MQRFRKGFEVEVGLCLFPFLIERPLGIRRVCFQVWLCLLWILANIRVIGFEDLLAAQVPEQITKQVTLDCIETALGFYLFDKSDPEDCTAHVASDQNKGIKPNTECLTLERPRLCCLVAHKSSA